jgi:thiosulfate/3-mercaptopyruvate sulfurtransferase
VDVTKGELAARLADPRLTVLDVRSPEEYSGVLGAPCDPRQGHIPGARNVDVQELLGLSPEELRALVGLPDGAEIVAYCHSGSRSALAVQLLRAVGYDAKNYVGSWHEWSRDESLAADSSAG